MVTWRQFKMRGAGLFAVALTGTLFFFGAFVERVDAALYAVGLSNPIGGAGYPGTIPSPSSPSHVLNDPFPYDPDADYATVGGVPYADRPITRWDTPPNWAIQVFITQNQGTENWVAFDVNLAPLQTLDYLDIWGRTDYAAAEYTRHQNFIVSFYSGPGGTGTLLGASAPYSGVTTSAHTGDDNIGRGSAYGRFDVSSVLGAADRQLVQSVRLDKNDNDYFLIAEIRAASMVPVPEPSSLVAAPILLLGMLEMRRRKN